MKLTAIRLDILDEERDKQLLLSFLEAEGRQYVVYREIADITGKPHFQGYMLRDEETYDEQKEVWLRLFRQTHTRYQRSFTPVKKVLHYMQYVAKDKNLVIAIGFSSEHVKANEEASYAKKTKKSQETVDTMHIVLIDYIKKKYALDVYTRFTLTRTGMEIADYYLKERRKFPMDHFARALTKGVFIELSRSEVYRRERLSSIVKTWFNGDDQIIDSLVDHQGI